MRILVTGAAGMLGHRVLAEAERRGHETVATDIDDLDLTNADAVSDRWREVRPDAVIHCGAYTDVDRAESEEEFATLVNGDASGNVAVACAATGAFLVAVSTDYVFAGDASEPYLEDDEPAPRTAYGRSKLIGEKAITRAGGDFAICRTAWLYGAGGKNFVDTMLALGAERDEVSVVTDQVGCPTWTGHLAPALVEIAERRATGIHHLTGGGQCSWHDLAVAVFRTAGLDCRVAPTTSDAFVRPAPRPAYSVLGQARDDTVALPPWEDGLAAYLSERVPA